MESNEFYTALSKLPSSYSFNPVTAVAYRHTGEVYGTNKRETLKAGKALGLTREFTSHVYNATAGVSNRGNTQVVRGKIRSALGV
jgi:hypothetical protein